MGLFGVLDISAAGMDVQQARLEAAASNLAHSRTTRTASGEMYKPLSVVVHGAPIAHSGLSRPVVAQLVAQDVPPHLIYDPGHPDANAQGFVAMPGVDPLTSMLDLMSISRGYEANLHAFDITRTLLQRAIDIGGRR